MTTETKKTEIRQGNNSWLWIILGIIALVIAGYFYMQNKGIVDFEKLFNTYYVQPAEIDNIRGEGPFRNQLDKAYYQFSQSKFDECIGTMKKVLKDDTTNQGYVSMAHYIMAHCYIHKKEFSKANKELEGSMHFGVPRQKLLIKLLEGKISETEYNDRKVFK